MSCALSWLNSPRLDAETAPMPSIENLGANGALNSAQTGYQRYKAYGVEACFGIALGPTLDDVQVLLRCAHGEHQPATHRKLFQ